MMKKFTTALAFLSMLTIPSFAETKITPRDLGILVEQNGFVSHVTAGPQRNPVGYRMVRTTEDDQKVDVLYILPTKHSNGLLEINYTVPNVTEDLVMSRDFGVDGPTQYDDLLFGNRTRQVTHVSGMTDAERAEATKKNDLLVTRAYEILTAPSSDK
jgi:hypothetical protein